MSDNKKIESITLNNKELFIRHGLMNSSVHGSLNITEDGISSGYTNINNYILTTIEDGEHSYVLTTHQTYVKYPFNRIAIGKVTSDSGSKLSPNSYIDLNDSYIKLYDSKYRLNTLL